jgi:hypothetical protein
MFKVFKEREPGGTRYYRFIQKIEISCYCSFKVKNKCFWNLFYQKFGIIFLITYATFRRKLKSHRTCSKTKEKN